MSCAATARAGATMAAHDDDDALVQRLHVTHQRAQALAVATIKQYTPFRALPTQVAKALLIGYDHDLHQYPMTEHEGEMLLVRDVERAFNALRNNLFPLLEISPVRMAVVLHLALVMGFERVHKLPGFWPALKAGDYEAAADAVLLSEWRELIGNEPHNKRRAVDLLYALRTGNFRDAPPKGSTHAH